LDIFLQQVINGLTLGSVYAVVALGYTMVYGIIQLINFAHGEVVMIGAMVAYTVIVVLTRANVGLPPLAVVLAGLMVAIPACMAVGYTLERVAYRPLRRAPRLAPLITAIGLSIILQHVAMIVWSRNPLPYPQIVQTVSYHITTAEGGATITNVQIAIIGGSFLMMGGLLVLTVISTACGATKSADPVAASTTVPAIAGSSPSRLASEAAKTHRLGFVPILSGRSCLVAHAGSRQHSLAGARKTGSTNGQA